MYFDLLFDISVRNGQKTRICRCFYFLLLHWFEVKFHFKIHMNTRMNIMDGNEAAVGHFVTTEMEKLH